MQNTTADYKIEINKPSRSFECKITIGNNIYTNEDLVNLTLEFTQPQEGFSIGGTISKSLDLTLLNRGDIIYSTSQIKVEIGLKIGSKIEYILMGLFNIDDIEKTDYTTKFTAYDNMIKFETDYFSELGDKPTLQQVVNELSSKTGVEFTGSLPTYTVSKLDGFSCREVLSYVASICCGNALITRDGKFTIKTLGEVEKSIDGSNYFNYTREEVKYKVGQISCQVDENNILSKGSIGTDSMELGFENPWVTENILNDLYNKLNGLSYLGYSMKWQGDISLDPYDIITVTDVKNVVRKIPILSQKITYTGGLTSEIGAKGETKNKNSFSSSGSTTNKVNRAVIEQAIIKEALIEKANIKDVEAVSIRTQTLEAKTAKIEEAIIDVAHIKDLNAINANIQNLIAADATINNALINKADITELNAVKGTINSLDSKIANIETLVNGNLSSENIQAGGITSDKLTIANGFITNAMIANLDVSKINAGDFSTNKFRIVSDSGKMLIADNTIQIRDNNRVRVQIGKDASNDYSMYVWDSAGKLMFDATGLKADGIKNKIIRDDMISDNANIDGSKINISSLITEINKDTNTTVIKSSKVQLDTLGQTLDVAFNSLKSNVDNMEIGGRNLWIKSKTTGASAIEYLGENHITGQKECYKLNNGATLTFNIEPAFSSRLCRKVTFSAWVKYENVVQGENNWNKFNCFKHALLRKNSLTGATTTSQDFTTLFGFTGTSDWKRITSTYDYTFNGYDQLKTSLRFNIEGAKSGTAWVTGIKVELGDKATDYSDALEDVDSSIESVKQITESNSTTISVMQGQIATAINNTQIVKDGQTVLLKDDYNRTVAKVDSINSTIGTHTTKINDLTGSITNVDTKVNSVQRDLEGTKSTVSSHSTSITDLSSKVSTQGTSISQLQNQIKLKVESTEVNTIVNGAISKTAKSLDVMYYLSTSATSLAGGSWSTTAPTWTNGKYMWSKTVTTFVDGSKKESSPTCIAGATGANGSAGKGIKSIVEQYYLSISNTTQTGGSWVTSPPAWANGKYMWTRSIITYTDNSTTTTNPVCVSGSKGDTGAKGDKGATGAKGDTGVGISSVDVEYYLSTSATSLAGGSWSTTAPAWVNGKYMWSRTKTVTTTGATTYSNPVCITGAKGATGATGTKGDKGDAGATGQGISSITEEYYLSTSKLSQTGGSWVTTPPTWSTGKYMWTRSKIVYKNPTSTAYTTPVCDSNWEAVNEVQVGGRNLIKDSNFIVQATASAFATTKPVVLVSGLDLNAIFLGKTVSFSYFVHNVGSKQNGSGSLGSRFGIHGSIQWKNSSTGATTTYYPFAECLDGVYKNTRVSMKYTFNPPSGYDTIAGFSFSFQPLSRPGSGNAEIWKIGQPKLEIGNKATDWSPAPEDVDTSIANVQTQITNTSNKVATIETNLNSITSRVSSTETKVTTINGNITSLQSRMNTAEQKITPTAITTTISSTISGGTGSISTTQFVMDKNGLTINNGALIIKNKAGKTVLSSDSNGNLLYTGALYAQVDSSHYAKIEPILTNNNKDVKLRLSLVGNTEHSNFDVVNAAGVRLFKVGHGGVEIHKYLTLDTDQTGTYNTRCYWENGTYRPAVAEKALIGTNTYYFNSVFSRYFGRDRISGSYTTVQAGAVNIRTAYQGEGCYFDTDGYFRPAAQGAWANGHPSYRWSTLYSVNGVNASSDLRLKENVEYIQETNGISRLSSKGNNITQEDMYNFIKDEFKLASYNYKGEKFEGNTELSYNLGFIAQDLKDSNVGRQFIIPPQEEEGAYSYNMGSYIGVLAGALRIAINKIESLENRIKVLESKGA